MKQGKTGGTARRLAILLLPAIIVVVGALAFRAWPTLGQAEPERDSPSGPAAEVGPPPSVGEAQPISGDTAMAFGIPPAESQEAVEAAMQQAAPRGETPIDPVDRLAAEPADTVSQQEDLAVSGGEEPSAGVLQRNFPGVTYTGWIPPDDQIAAGPNHLVIPLNGAVAYFDKGGNNLYQTTLTGFFGSLADPVDSVFDPRIIWDHDLGRFILLAVGRNTTTQVSYYFLAISATSNPLDGWCQWRMDAQIGDPNVWADYPDLGVGPNGGLYITSNQFTWAGAFAGAQLFTIDKALAASCTSITGWINGPFTDGDGGLSFTLRPSVEYDPAFPSQAEWIVNSNSTNATWLTIWRVINNMPAAPTFSGVTLGVNAYSTPPDARQPGGVQSLDIMGTRLLNAVSRWDYVWTVGTDECNFGGGATESCVRWYQIDLYNWPTMVIDHQSSYGATDRDYFYPGITANDTNDVVIVFARSGTTEYAQARHTARLATGPVNDLQNSALLKAGEERYLRLFNGRNRWGDYAGISYGANDEFWILHQYADDPYPPGHWDTWVGCIGLDESQCAALAPTLTNTPTNTPTPTNTYTPTPTPTNTPTPVDTPTATATEMPVQQDPTFSIARNSPSAPVPVDPADLVVRQPGGAPPPTMVWPCGPGGFWMAFCLSMGAPLPGDDVNAVSLGKDFTLPPPDPDNPDAYVYFSVAPGAMGIPGTGVNNETVGAGCIPEPEADEFGSDAAGGNYQFFDGDGVASCANPGAPALGLAEPPPLGGLSDDLDAVDPRNFADTGPPIFVSLDRSSPSLGTFGGSAADIYIDFGLGIASWYAMPAQLGLDSFGMNSDDIDALCILDDGNNEYDPRIDTVWFSLAAGSASLGIAGDSPADVFAAPFTPGAPVVSGGALGLLDAPGAGDDLNALKCYEELACIDRDGDTTCRDPVNDPDDDGCTAAQEAALGTDPDAWYDVFDVPVPANSDPTPNGPRNRYVDIGDVLAVLFYTFAAPGGPPNANGVSYDSTKGMSSPHIDPPQNLVVGIMYDRTPGDLDPDGAGPFIDPAGPPNGAIDMGDVLIVLVQANMVDCT